MKNKPPCPLCSQALVLEQNVTTQAANPGWILAWVCTNCSAAFPVATGKGGLMRSPTPLYVDGKRTV
ncbi:MAG TPA: hypothetical protein VKP65_13550 [Rhodothermales bacterium]|nr:hypothetical protein [Rhodothermales bacterium]